MPSGLTTLTFAHAYGNTRSGLKRSLKSGVDGIETDIWLRGAAVFVRHEPRLDPLPLLVDRRMPLHSLPPWSLALPRHYYARLDINRLHLAELLRTVNGSKRLLLDVKGHYNPAQSRLFAERIAQALSEYGRPDLVEICGQFWPVLEELRNLAPEIAVRYSIERRDQWQKFVTMIAERPDARLPVCIEHRFLDKERARFISERRIGVYCWTVDDSKEAARLAQNGVDGIISNDLDLLRRRADAPTMSTPPK